MGEFNVWTSLPAVAPEIGLTILAMVILLLDAYLPKEKNRARNIAFVSAVCMAILALTPFIWAPAPNSSELFWGGMVRHDALGQLFDVMILLAGAITAMIAVDDSGVGRRGEFHLIVVIVTLGGCMLSSAADLIMVFVALETVSIPLYVLAAFRREDNKSSESGMKYFLFGSFASAILLYGFSFLYGLTGSTQLTAIAAGLNSDVASGNLVAVLTAIVMVLVGFGFKVSAVPFHFWTPDVYEGSPTSVTAFVSVASKAGSFAVFMRFLIEAFGLPPVSVDAAGSLVVIDGQTVQTFWVNLITVCSILSMTLGNVLALRQKNFKRLLAYSSIAQAGYTLIGLAALQSQSALGQDIAMASVTFYMFMYTFTNLVVFAGIVLFVEATGREEIADFAGLQRRSPWLALAMTIGLLSLGGIPPAAGFFGKLFLFQAAVEAHLAGLAIIGVLNAIVALYYYLVIIKVMYVDQGVDEDKPLSISRPYAWILGITSVVIILLGVIPTPIFDLAQQGAAAVRLAMGS